MGEVTDAIGVVHGIDNTYVVLWPEADLAQLKDTETQQVVHEFASSNEGGFIHADDVIEQARDIVAEWDEADLG